MIRNEKCEVLDKQNFGPKYRMVYDNETVKILQRKMMINRIVCLCTTRKKNLHVRFFF